MKIRKQAVIGIFAAAGGIAATGIYFYGQNRETIKQEPQLPEGMSLSEDAVYAGGLTGVGMSEEVCELGFLENGLYIEEVYLNMGDEVEAGEAVFKVSEESLEEARSELEKTVTQTALESRQGKLDYETGLEEAQKGKELAQIEAEWAQTVYDNAAAEAAEELESVQEQTDEAQKKADEYTASVEEDYYYTYYKVGELEEQWKDYAAFLQQLYTEWDVDGLESIFGGSGGKNGIGYVTNQVGSSGSGTAAAAQENSNTEAGVFFSQETEKAAEEASESQETPESEAFPEGEAGGFEMSGESGMKGMLPAGANPGSDEIRYNIYLAMEEEVQECEAAYEEAKEQYEEAKETAQAGLAQAKSELAVLQAKLTKQQNTYEKALVEAQTAYDLAIANNENAELVYEASVKQLEEEYQSLLDKEETAAEQLELFEETIGDGVFYTKENGTVMMTNVHEGSWLTEDGMVLAYTDPDTVTVSANVGQEDIDKISIGEEAVVVISGYGAYTGTVTGFDPTAEASRSTSVTYTVTVALEGEVSELEANLTSYVYFGLTEEEKQMLMEAQENQTSGNSAPEGMELPEGMERPEKLGQPGGNGVSGGDGQ